METGDKKNNTDEEEVDDDDEWGEDEDCTQGSSVLSNAILMAYNVSCFFFEKLTVFLLSKPVKYRGTFCEKRFRLRVEGNQTHVM